jgi:hypothetical protein
MRVKNCFAVILALSLTPMVFAASAPALKVAVDPRVELISIIFRLAGNPEYNQARVDSYAADVEKQFRPFASHAVVKLARRLRRDDGVSYDACMSMAVQLQDAYELRPIVPFEPRPDGFDKRWSAQSGDEFLRLARQFVKDTGFREFIANHESLYQTTAKRMQTLIDAEAHLEWFNEFFGEHGGADFTLIPALLNGGQCYGPHCRDGAGAEHLYCVLGVWKTDSEGAPTFTAEMVPTVVHEFNHSYANPIIDGHMREFEPAGDKLFSHVADAMRRQAYASGHTVLCESLVRASLVRYELKFHGAKAASREIQAQDECSFVWTKELSDLLGDYERQRDKYPTLNSFALQLVKFFGDYADQFQQKQASKDGNRPKVVSIFPVNGTRNVDPGVKELRIVFDRPMRGGSWSLAGGGAHYPGCTNPHYESDRKTWVATVDLKPNWDYECWINSQSFHGFQSANGVPAKWVHVTFSTGEARH